VVVDGEVEERVGVCLYIEVCCGGGNVSAGGGHSVAQFLPQSVYIDFWVFFPLAVGGCTYVICDSLHGCEGKQIKPQFGCVSLCV